MKTKISSFSFLKIIPQFFLFLAFIPATDAQTLTLEAPSLYRRVLLPFYATDSHGGTYQPNLFAITNVDGAFNINETAATPPDFFFISAGCTASQDSIVTATPTSLSITGAVEISSSGSAVDIEGQSSGNGSGAASWAGLSEIIIGFTIDRSFTYSLQVTTAMNTNSTETVPIAMAGIDDHGDSVGSLPDIVAYGSMTYPGGVATAPSASGTSTGILTNGTYYFIARVHSMTELEPGNSPMAEHFLTTFNLSVTYVPQAPIIMAFTPDGAGAFNLIWNAPQAGNYRVLSSTNLMAWSELIPGSTLPSGLNTNTVSVIPGSNAGFFRVEYLP